MDWLFFDFDGLLADTEPLHMRAFDLAFEKLGIASKSDPKNWVGRNSRELLMEVIAATKTSVPLDTIRQTRREIYRRLVSEAQLMPNALDVLKAAKNRFKLGLVTSSGIDEIAPVLEKQKIKDCFQVIVTWQANLKPKPAPDMYLEALKRTETTAPNAIALEDSSRGVQAAKAAGLYCIAVPNEYTINQDLSKADALAKNLEEAWTLLQRF